MIKGVRSVCDNSRNLGDEEIRGIARSGGVMGVAYFRPAVCGETELQGIVATIKYIKCARLSAVGSLPWPCDD